MNRSEANRIINAAKNEGKKDKICAAYKQVWEASVEIPMDSSTFVSLFYEGNPNHNP